MGLTWTGAIGALAEVNNEINVTTVRCGSVIDGISEQALGPLTLGIQSGRIVSIVATPPENIVDLDLSDYTCLPGLINTHVHFDANPEDAADYGVYARRSQADNLGIDTQKCRDHVARWLYNSSTRRGLVSGYAG